MIFIVGNSRSGTTLMGRILGANSRVHTFEEIHFFENLVSDAEILRDAPLPPDRREALARKLLASARGNIFSSPDDPALASAAAAVMADADGDGAASIYRSFIRHEVRRAGKAVGCEQTPRYLFSLEACFHAYPDARVVIMVRDPRDVLISQRGKWRTFFHGSWDMPWHEALRVWSNYHPILIAKIWSSASDEERRWAGDPRVMTLRFEDLAFDPERSIREVARHCRIDFEPAMLEADDIGSSIVPDRDNAKGINQATAYRWKSKPLRSGELAAISTICGPQMARYSYEPARIAAPFMHLAASAPGLVLKSAPALLLNIHRSRRVFDFIRKRFLR